MTDVPTAERAYASCPTCGEAVGTGWTKCPSCDEQFSPENRPKTSTVRAPRLRLMKWVRIVVVVAVIAGVAVAIIQPTLSGSPALPDPLTTSGAYTIAPGNTTVLGGAITGEDYIEGNFTVVSPVGASLTWAVYNSTEFLRYANHQPATPAASVPPAPNGRVIFAAPYTDNFYFVFANPYPGASGVVLKAYIVTNYETNVVIG